LYLRLIHPLISKTTTPVLRRDSEGKNAISENHKAFRRPIAGTCSKGKSRRLIILDEFDDTINPLEPRIKSRLRSRAVNQAP
jgi:hypothetical protein